MNHSLYEIGDGGRPGEREVPRSANYAEVTLNSTEKRRRLNVVASCEQRKAGSRKTRRLIPGTFGDFRFSRQLLREFNDGNTRFEKKKKNKNKIRVIKQLPALYLSRLIVNTVGETPILNAAEKTVVDVHIDIY